MRLLRRVDSNGQKGRGALFKFLIFECTKLVILPRSVRSGVFEQDDETVYK